MRSAIRVMPARRIAGANRCHVAASDRRAVRAVAQPRGRVEHLVVEPQHGGPSAIILACGRCSCVALLSLIAACHPGGEYAKGRQLDRQRRRRPGRDQRPDVRLRLDKPEGDDWQIRIRGTSIWVVLRRQGRQDRQPRDHGADPGRERQALEAGRRGRHPVAQEAARKTRMTATSSSACASRATRRATGTRSSRYTCRARPKTTTSSRSAPYLRKLVDKALQRNTELLMGMYGVLITLSPKRLAQLEADPETLEDVLEARHETEIPGLLDLGVTWDALDVLLSDRGKDAAPRRRGPRRAAGEPLEVEAAFQSARVLDAKRVAEIAKKLDALAADARQGSLPLARRGEGPRQARREARRRGARGSRGHREARRRALQGRREAEPPDARHDRPLRGRTTVTQVRRSQPRRDQTDPKTGTYYSYTSIRRAPRPLRCVKTAATRTRRGSLRSCRSGSRRELV